MRQLNESHTPCSKRDLITSSSMAEFSSIFDTNGAIRSCAYFFTVKQRDRCLVIEDCQMASSCHSSRAHVTRAPAYLPPSSCSPPPSTFEGEERRSSQLPGLRTCLEQVCWTCSSIQPDMSPMVERSVCRSEGNRVSSDSV